MGGVKMNVKLGLLVTLLLGIFILLGALIAFFIKKKEKVVDFSLGLAFGVITMLVITDLLPEIIEELGLGHIYIFILGAIAGYSLLKLLDKFIPDHEETKDKVLPPKENLIHIGVVTSLALVLHNIIEGMAVYSTTITDISLGVPIAIGVGFHNIPLGIVIAGAFYQSNENIWKTIGIITMVSLSTFLGGLIMFFLDITSISGILLGLLLSVTLGMLIYIAYAELFPRIKEMKNRKVAYVGMAIGVMILLLSVLI